MDDHNSQELHSPVVYMFGTGIQFNPKQIKNFFENYVFYSNTDPEIERNFQDYIQKQTVQMAYPIFSIIAFVVILFWPTDFFIISDPDVFRTYIIWRSAAIIGIGFFFFGINFSVLFRQYINFAVITTTCLISMGIGYAFGRVSGLSDPWFWSTLIIPWLTIFLGMGPLKRFFATFSIIVSFATGFIVPFPRHLQYSHLYTVLILLSGMVFLITFAGHVLYHFMRKDYLQQQELEKKKEKLRKLARYDQLTGLLNRRYFENKLDEEFERANRYDNELSILMMDLDYFKEVNDTYGHQAGDRVLETTGNLINDHTRASDSGARYGGEEFCIMLPETGLNRAEETAERLRKSLSEYTFETDDGDTFTVTCSIGLARQSDNMNDFTDLIKSADKVLYEAKEAGRNRVVINN